MNEVDLGEFMKFCKDFEIPLSKAKLTEIFKKSSINHKPHKIEQFTNSLGKIGQELNKIKLEELYQRVKEVNKLLKQKLNESNTVDQQQYP